MSDAVGKEVSYQLIEEHEVYKSIMAATEDNKAFVSTVDSVDDELGIPRAFDLPTKYTNREKMRLVIIDIKWQASILVASIIDIILLLVQVGTGDSSETNRGITVITWMILGWYMVDILMRLYVFHLYLFFKNFLNVFDFLVVVISVVLSALEHSAAGSGVGILRGLRAAYRVAIAMRVLRSVSTMAQIGTTGAKQAARNVTGENKKRFVDLEHNFDIDLTYINTEIIAMGVPSTGFIALYRNPIGEVVRFFNTRHKDRFKIYNVCPEHPYPHERFDNRVQAFDVQDHTPPTMDILMEFLIDANKFMSEGDERIIAVHCRGGKGRTGSIVCTWLLFSQFCKNAMIALEYFAQARTELRKKSNKLQGVDTPSQKRYIMQVDSWLNRIGAYRHTNVEITKPPPTELTLHTLNVSKFFSEPEEETGPLVVAVHQLGAGGGKIVFVSPPLDTPVIQSNELKFELQGLKVRGDVRVTIFEKSKLEVAVNEGLVLADAPGFKGPDDLSKRKIAGKEPGVLFYFIFHTEFVDKDNGQLRVPMPMMDKAFKNKKKRYLPSGIALLKTSAS